MTSTPPEDPAHAIPTASHLRRSRRLWRVLTFMALAIAVLALAVRFGPDFEAKTAHVARVVIDGVIATDADRMNLLDELGEDGQVKAIIVAINSPGGTTAGGEELYEALSALRGKKPVLATINELGASAAYMTAIATDRIYARRLSIVGSIGVLYTHVNAGKLMDTIGIDLDKVATGPLKAEPDIDEPLVGNVRESLQMLVDDSYAWFVEIVAERRALDRARVLELADGRIMTGRMGVENGLIDAVGGEADAIAYLESEGLIAEDLPVVTRYPLPGTDFAWIGRFLGSQVRSGLGLPASGPIALDGLVSLWQANPS